ncbi:hypothetical protein MSG28_013089 [Choristoneura fumiferana]|uniref:Uncharacterized protein n=1 Tax=Choristoneura fumiferana TaxID=7141 RepID=A0ACC0KSK8_CHOFU|nr:hypothetical protein MSG28_013089 [Choristoneura fumiferana]
MIEDKKAYAEALEYLADLEFEDADAHMKTYGLKLIQHLPKESTKFLIALCTDYKPRSKPLVDEASLSGGYREPDRADPDDYIHMFLSNSEQLIEFLEHMTAADVQAKSPDKKAEYEEKIMKVLRDPTANYDKDQTLVICQMLGFRAGILHLWRAQVALHMRAGEAEAALDVCRRRGALAPRLWLDVLWWRSPNNPPATEHLPELLSVIASEKLLSPILVVDCLASISSYTLGDVRKYLTDVLKSESDVITREQELAAKYKAESGKMKTHIHTLQHEPVTFQSSKCAACNRPLELPSVHFLCQHSFHQHCFQSYSESERECPACGTRARREPPPPAADSLHARLHQQHDP